jgi:hypothetical protein
MSATMDDIFNSGWLQHDSGICQAIHHNRFALFGCALSF